MKAWLNTPGIVLLLTMMSYPLFAAPLILEQDKTRYSIAQHVDVLEDKAAKWTITDITSDNIAVQFKPHNKSILNFGRTQSVYWLRLELKSDLPFADDFFLEINFPPLDSIEVYSPNSAGGFLLKKGGDLVPFRERDFLYPTYVFHLPIATQAHKTLYLRIQTESRMHLPATLWSSSGFTAHIKQYTSISAFFYGSICIMILYNLFILSATKDAIYFYYTLSLSAIGLLVMVYSGFAMAYLWPDFPAWANLSATVVSGLQIFTMQLFIQHFLNTKKTLPLMHRAIECVKISAVLLMIGPIFASYALIGKLFILLNFIVCFVALMTGIVGVVKGINEAKYYLAGWSFFVLGTFGYVLSSIGILPVNLFTQYGTIFGSLIEITFFSLGLADRIKRLQNDTTRAQQQNLEAQRALTQDLESKIQQRTASRKVALQHAQTEHEKLKQSQSQLVHAEKMAGLGSLVAGVAHEINNPANFVHLGCDALETELQQFKHFLLALIDQASDAEIIQIFELHFERILLPLHNIQAASTRIAILVQDLRTFSRLDEAAEKSVNLVENLQVSIRLVKTQYDDVVQFQEDYQAQPELLCFGAQLNQVFTHILMNACQAIQAQQRQSGDTAPGVLTVRTRQQNHALMITFEDTGCGMTSAVKAKIFDPFFTTKEVGEGAGLGMSIAYGIVEKHHGSMQVESEVGKGTVLTLSLPLVPT